MEIATRWYRSPEVILCENIYDFKIDTWSVAALMHGKICLGGAHTSGTKNGKYT